MTDSLHIRTRIGELLRIAGTLLDTVVVAVIYGIIAGQEKSLNIDLLVRMLRPCTQEMREYTNALKQRIKQGIVSRPGGPMLTAKFEK